MKTMSTKNMNDSTSIWWVKKPDLNIIMLEGNFKNTEDYSGVRSQDNVTFGRREGVLLNVDSAVSLELGGSVHFVIETYT